LFVIAAVSGAIGYLVSSFLWREVVARKRKRRLIKAAEQLPDVCYGPAE
jgi:hypothetical protein